MGGVGFSRGANQHPKAAVTGVGAQVVNRRPSLILPESSCRVDINRIDIIG
jgi:hypothetical protein